MYSLLAFLRDATGVLPVDPTVQLGVAGLIVVALSVMLGLLVRRVLITKGEKDESDADKDARLAEVRTNGEDWKKLAIAQGEQIDDLREAVQLSANVNAKALELLEKAGRDYEKVVKDVADLKSALREVLSQLRKT